MSNPFNPPDAPSPAKTAAAQTAANRETAVTQSELNATNQTTPTGSLSYTQQGTWADGTPRLVANQTLTPDQQAILDVNEQNALASGQLANQQVNRLGGVLGTNFQLGATPQGQGVNLNNQLDYSGSPSLSNNAINDRIVQLQQQRLDPQWQQRRQTTETDLINRGAVPGTEAYNRGMQQLEQAQNDAYNQMYIGSQNQMYQQALAGRGMADTETLNQFNAGNQTTQQEAQFNNAAQQQNWNQQQQDALLQRNQPINEITALMSGSQVSMPNWVNTPQTQVATTPIGQYIQDNYANQVSQYNAMLGGIAGVGGDLASTIKWSDRNLKKNVRKVPLALHSFNYKGEPPGALRHLGVMAQDVEKNVPGAHRKGIVAKDSKGNRMVNYGALASMGRR